jgi:hypothetical protein
LPIKTTTTTTNKKPQKSSYIKSNGELSSRVEETPFKPDFVKYIENSNQIVQQTQQQHQIESQLKLHLAQSLQIKQVQLQQVIHPVQIQQHMPQHYQIHSRSTRSKSYSRSSSGSSRSSYIYIVKTFYYV